MAPPFPVPASRTLYQRLLRLSGGRAAVPKGGSLDRELIGVLNFALQAGASRERRRTLGLIDEFRGKLFSEEGKDALVLLRERVIAASLWDATKEGP